MIEAIKSISKETQADWYSVVLALRDRNILNSTQIKRIEAHFFDLEDKGLWTQLG